MTSKNPGMAFDTEGFRKAFEGVSKVFAEVGFQLAAQGALGYLLQDEAEQTGAILDRMTEEQRIRLWIAAGALAGLASVGLDQPTDHEQARGEHWIAPKFRTTDSADDLLNQLSQKIGVLRADLALEVVRPHLDRLRADVALMAEMRDVHMGARDQWRRRAEQAEEEAEQLRVNGNAALDRVSKLAEQLDELAGPDRDWSVRAKDTAARIRAAITDDQPTKFETTGDLREQHDAHRRRLAAALEGSPCRNWDQLLTIAEQTHDTAIARQAEAEQLRTLANEILARFNQRGHPGQPCTRASWTPDDVVADWRQRAALLHDAQPSEMRFGVGGDPRGVRMWVAADTLDRAREEAERLRALASVVLDACQADPYISPRRFAEWRTLLTESTALAAQPDTTKDDLTP